MHFKMSVLRLLIRDNLRFPAEDPNLVPCEVFECIELFNESSSKQNCFQFYFTSGARTLLMSQKKKQWKLKATECLSRQDIKERKWNKI